MIGGRSRGSAPRKKARSRRRESAAYRFAPDTRKKRKGQSMIRTERLMIRRIAAGDREAIRDMWKEVARTPYARYDTPKDTSDAAVRARIERWAACADSREHLFFAVCLKETVIGYIALNKRDNGYEAGYCFHPAYHGKGYARESLAAVIGYMKENNVSLLTAGTALENTPSVRLLESVGFRLTGTEKVSFYRDEQGNALFFDGGIFELRL